MLFHNLTELASILISFYTLIGIIYYKKTNQTDSIHFESWLVLVFAGVLIQNIMHSVFMLGAEVSYLRTFKLMSYYINAAMFSYFTAFFTVLRFDSMFTKRDRAVSIAAQSLLFIMPFFIFLVTMFHHHVPQAQMEFTGEARDIIDFFKWRICPQYYLTQRILYIMHFILLSLMLYKIVRQPSRAVKVAYLSFMIFVVLKFMTTFVWTSAEFDWIISWLRGAYLFLFTRALFQGDFNDVRYNSK